MQLRHRAWGDVALRRTLDAVEVGGYIRSITSPGERIEVLCPECGEPYSTAYRASVNADLDPEAAADREWLEEVSTGTCPSCGHRVDLGTLLTGEDDLPPDEPSPPKRPEDIPVVWEDPADHPGSELFLLPERRTERED